MAFKPLGSVPLQRAFWPLMVAQQELRKDARKASLSTGTFFLLFLLLFCCCFVFCFLNLFLKKNNNTVVFLHHFLKSLVSWLSLINLHLGRLSKGWNVSYQKGTAGMSVSEVQIIIDYCSKTQHHSLFWVILVHIKYFHGFPSCSVWLLNMAGQDVQRPVW